MPPDSKNQLVNFRDQASNFRNQQPWLSLNLQPFQQTLSAASYLSIYLSMYVSIHIYQYFYPSTYIHLYFYTHLHIRVHRTLCWPLNALRIDTAKSARGCIESCAASPRKCSETTHANTPVTRYMQIEIVTATHHQATQARGTKKQMPRRASQKQ